MTVVRANAVPLYHQIFLSLRDEIVSGRRAIGSIMPTEHEITDDMGVSRITARRALDELAAEGFVERRRRTGTRVIYQAASAPIEANIEQAVESLLAFGRSTQVKVALFEEVEAPAAIAEKLRLGAGEPVLHAVRVRSMNNEPLGQIESFVPARHAAAIPRSALTTTPLLALLQQGGIHISGGKQTIAASSATPELAVALEIEPRAAILIIERIVTDASGEPAVLTIAQYRADRYKISVDLHAFAPQKSSDT